MSFDSFFMEVIKNFVDLVSNSSILTFLFSLPIIYICIRVPFRLLYCGMTGRSPRKLAVIASEPEPKPEPGQQSCGFQCSDTLCEYHESKKYCYLCDRFRLCSFCVLNSSCEESRKGVML